MNRKYRRMVESKERRFAKAVKKNPTQVFDIVDKHSEDKVLVRAQIDKVLEMQRNGKIRRSHMG